ncbi:MAG: bifunctional demethylmenaquinone methyltransferase/2-methoxy-6-polyprenyl-1,4-benzoquinol methylase UbiE [Gammaproteobacteria bacterium]|nr:MAG: bifunctional demethylmenaquinone methyltransferase/2-methoxy-6-polyprenyl-1,4-benzoquinol methylase UbiE [Gammaproteobacteria bacterium]
MVENMTDKTTHFGFRTVDARQKASMVRGVFDSVTDRYDLMNDLMSIGLHRLWKRYVASMTHLRKGQCALDLAAGTGDMTRLLASQVGRQGKVVSTDINHSMLEKGRARLEDCGLAGNIEYVIANAETLPFSDNQFDCITMAFGLRNVTNPLKALNSIYKAIRPGGRVLILEFSKLVTPTMQGVYDQYSFKILPVLGKLVGGDEEAYQYLVESIRMHPDQESLKELFLQAGFDKCEYQNIHGGIVAIHSAWKY